MTKEELALAVIERLKQEYPDADCTLDYDQAWKLLVSVRLAAQCTDARVNVVVEDLYAKYPDIDALANATPEEIEEIVRPCGLGKSKARDINACMRMLRDEYRSQVPDDFNTLLKLPGVGRKSANLIMGDVFKKPAIVTDTHCIRLCNRIGLVHDCKDPKKVEMALWKIVPPEEGSSLCHRFVEHGREVCTARTTPHCAFLFLFFIRPKEVRQRFQRFPEHLHFLFSEFRHHGIRHLLVEFCMMMECLPSLSGQVDVDDPTVLLAALPLGVAFFHQTVHRRCQRSDRDVELCRDR